MEAERRGERLVVVNTGHHGDNTDPSYAAPQDLDALDAQLTARGVDHEIRQPTRGRAPADELLDAADDVGATLIVIGLRRRSPLGQADHRLDRAAGAARRRRATCSPSRCPAPDLRRHAAPGADRPGAASDGVPLS